MAYEVFDETPEGRVVYLRAKTLLTPFVFAEERPRRLHQSERDALTQFLADDEIPASTPMTAPRVTENGTFTLQVRFSDVDVYGHVNNVKYFEFFQEARIDYMSRIWNEIPADTARVPMVMARMDVDYRHPILFRLEPYQVHSWVSHVGTSSFVIESEIREGDRLFSRARVVLVTFDKVSQKAAPAPVAYRELLAAELPA
jgi:acyl-CoA thioester hydrolase